MNIVTPLILWYLLCYMFDGKNSDQPLQLGIWKCENISEHTERDRKFLSNLEFAILSYYLLTGTDYLEPTPPEVPE